jgi:uncharacterized membrane protein
MTPSVRTFALTVHVVTAVGWFGAVLVFLVLGIIGLASSVDLTVRGVYTLMQPAAWAVLVPLAFASLVTGLAMSLGTTWGVFHHYWVLLKLLITVVATLILLVYMGTFREMARVAADASAPLGLVRNPSPVLHAVLAVIALVTATALAIYKPLGMTAYGRSKRRLHEPVAAASTPAKIPFTQPVATPRWVYVCAIVAVHLLLILVFLHFTGTSLVHH